MRMRLMATLSVALLSACHPADGISTPTEPQGVDTMTTADGDALAVTAIAHFNAPWAMTFLPDGNRLLVTEKGGALKLVQLDSGEVGQISGVPDVVDEGQGGLGDVILGPDFPDSQQVYLSYAEAGKGDTSGAAVARAKLVLDQQGGGKLTGLEVIWRQVPKVQGHGHYGHRLAFGPDGYLWISSGERQKFDPAQNLQSTLGKIVRLNADGSVPKDNPFADQGEVAAQVWSLGHRNPLGIAFDAEGQLWNIEMGPSGGDELNQVVRGGNYGYPIVSNGDHYDGRPIPDHDTQPEYNAPEISWTPVISPASLVIYSGDAFPHWQGDAFIAGLSAAALIRVELTPGDVREAERFDMDTRIREVEQGPAGNLWLLEDGKDGRLLRLSPVVDITETATSEVPTP
ncbi:PQQ-dependent sugar dehydrogenase [Lysobacter sp. A286]